MDRTCPQCQATFTVTDDDLAFYEEVSPTINGETYTIPPPTLCPPCRLQRRICFRNERCFYRRTCDATGKDIISIYAPDAPYTVYEQTEWWSDNWDPLAYGRDIDFERPFFEQVAELWKEVPLISLWNVDCENALYNNNCFSLKDSYMCYNSDHGERCLYCYVTERGQDMTDCAFAQDSELCYQCIDCTKCYQCLFSQLLDNCNHCLFCSDCIGCQDCFGCHGLRQKKYHMYNEALSEDEYKKRIADMQLTHERIQEYQKQSEAVRLTVPQLCVKQVQCEQCTGNMLYNCKNVQNSFDVHNAENVQNAIYSPWDVRQSRDLYATADIELGYEVMAGGQGIFKTAFINGLVNGLNDSYYCVLCGGGSKHLFGCISLMRYDYCILNKQYSKEEYESLVPKIIAHMQSTGEWGEYFPVDISPFAYNETIAPDFFPLSQQEAEAKGYRWKDIKTDPPEATKTIQAHQLPESITDIPDDILNWAIVCDTTKKPFKITKQELSFYRTMKVPVPRLHPEERYRQRIAKRLPRQLWERQCHTCQKNIQTAYAPERPEKVYCEECYLKEVY